MSKTFRFGALILLGAIGASVRAQSAPPQDATPPAATPPAAASAQPVAATQAPPPKDPYVLEDGGLYIQPIYWLNKAQPRLRGGRTATDEADFPYGGHAKAAIGAEIGFPAGRSNTVRITYFRIQGNSSVTLGQPATIFSEPYAAGDFINATYKLQAVKLSWDYLSYTWHKRNTAIHLKTLYEVQYVTTKLDTAAPELPVTTDASGNTDDNTASGSKSVVLPTFGMAMGSSLGKFFRWDVRASGFGLPKRSVIGDVEGSIGIRLGKVELVAGEKLFYFKTSPRGDMYVTDTLQGVYGGLRFAWRGNF